jgi:hypothetical protein
VWSSWLRDIRLAKSRLIVPTDYTQNLGRGQGATFDLDQELYVPIKTPLGDSGGDEITINQFAIRVAEHQQTCEELIEAIIRGAGFSVQTFGGYGDAAITATEVDARTDKTNTTRGKKILYVRPALADITYALLWVEQHMFGVDGIEAQKPKIEFPKPTQPDALTLAQTAQALRAARAASDETIVKTIHPDWTDKQVRAEVAAIAAQAPPPAFAPSPAEDVPADRNGDAAYG